MHVSCMAFAAAKLRPEDIKDKTVIDVGSYNHNGNLYDLYKHYNPSEFIGTDLLSGPGVDVVCPAEDLVSKFGKEQFDVVLSSELLEHARNWREVISSIKQLVKSNGIVLITTRSKGFPLHDYPHDYWRYELEDMRKLFSDMEILSLENDPQAPGVFIKVRKPIDFNENDLSDIALYSIIEDDRTVFLNECVESAFQKKCKRREKWLQIFKSVEKWFLHLGHKLIFK